MTSPDADYTAGLTLCPELEKHLAAFVEAGDETNAAVVRRCIELIRGHDPGLAARVWRANAETLRQALDAAATG